MADMDTPSDEDKLAALYATYMDLLHAVQSGCEYGVGGMTGEPGASSPNEWRVQKHLRVGITSVNASIGAVAKLLVAKGVFTEIEHFEYLVKELELMVKEFETELAAKYPGNMNIKLR